MQRDDLQLGISLLPSVLTYQKNEFMLVGSFPSSGHTDKVTSKRCFFEQESPDFIALRSKESQHCEHGLAVPPAHSASFA